MKKRLPAKPAKAAAKKATKFSRGTIVTKKAPSILQMSRPRP